MSALGCGADTTLNYAVRVVGAQFKKWLNDVQLRIQLRKPYLTWVWVTTVVGQRVTRVVWNPRLITHPISSDAVEATAVCLRLTGWLQGRALARR